VADLVELPSRLYCRIRLIQAEEAFAKAIAEWGFSASENGEVWDGYIAGPDRLRFLGLLSRYAALLSAMEISEVEQQRGASINVV
ncbi:MAG: ABC transporter ATP-binding protein, partial [Candidatus Thiodiazotropha taylori]|nr:ABC transporter ATP-binding protein [Candidatus Thiodiazotropha taylori]MCW4231742.1 ABC transporter ATP-binding protein [Candidatus Thiodiazotropha taylori]